MMGSSSNKPMEWSLFVDTDSLYLHTRQVFGVRARMDYLQLPANIIRCAGDIGYFRDKVALTMRLGKDWASFAESMQRFGYDTIPADRGMQPMTIAAKVMSLLSFCEGIVLVTSSNKILPLIEQIQEKKASLRVFSFSKELVDLVFSIESSRFKAILMDESWLWSKNGGRESF